tara:strand:+ start:17665 stop:18315 length:651 start_codon:yes stop_codon:yes gene_type:complete
MNPFTSILLAALFVTTVSFAQKKERGSMQEIKVIFTPNMQSVTWDEATLVVQKYTTIKQPFLKTKPSNKLTSQLKKVAVLNGKPTELHTLTANANYDSFLFGNDKTAMGRLKVRGDYYGDNLKPTKFADGSDTQSDYLKPKNEFTDSGDVMSDYFKPTVNFINQTALVFIPKAALKAGTKNIQAKLLEKGTDYEVWQWIDAIQKPQPELILVFTVE